MHNIKTRHPVKPEFARKLTRWRVELILAQRGIAALSGKSAKRSSPRTPLTFFGCSIQY